MAVEVKETIYEGRPMLTIEWLGTYQDPRPISIGVGKCKKILEAIPQIQAFVKKYQASKRGQK